MAELKAKAEADAAEARAKHAGTDRLPSSKAARQAALTHTPAPPFKAPTHHGRGVRR